MRRKLLVVGWLMVFLSFPGKILAVTVTVNNSPPSVSSEIFSVGVSISGAIDATNYLRVDLYKEGTNNYFGETYNGLDWYSGSEGKNYFPVQIQNSSASAILQAQMGNPTVNYYPCPGTYKLRIRRYTSSGSQSQNDQQTPVDIQLTYVSPTPTSTPTPTGTSTPTAAPTSTSTPRPTNTPTPSHTPTPSSTPRPTAVPTPTVTSTPTPVKTITPVPTESLGPTGEVLGTEEGLVTGQPAFYPMEEEKVVSEAGLPETDKRKTVAKVIIITGFILLFGVGMSIWYTLKSKDEKKS